MDIAFCYESVLPRRGGCETYIGDLARRLARDGHAVHLFGCEWDADSLPSAMHFHPLRRPRGPRFLRPWRFAAACARALRRHPQLVSIGFNKTWGQDVLYPQGGLHAASARHNLGKYRTLPARIAAGCVKSLDLAHWSYSLLERKQYLERDDDSPRPIVVVNSAMVARHFAEYFEIPNDRLRVVYSAIDPERFVEHDRLKRRAEWRDRWRITAGETVGLFVAMNYRLKGLDPLLAAVARMSGDKPFRLVVAGDPNTGRYVRLAERLGIASRVCFVGHCAETRNAYFAADFLVHPTFYDPCSLVVLEALACGLPVITSRFNGASELLSPPREGYVVADPHDHSVLSWCLEQLLDPATRTACSQAARATAAHWTFEQHYQKLLGIFAEVAAAKEAA